MNQLLLKQVRILDPNSPHHLSKQDILIVDGRIQQVESSIASDAPILEGNNHVVSPGWLDMRANFRDPGFEYKEDLKSGAKAAMMGGFTAVALLPDTFPIIQSKSEVDYLRANSNRLPIDLLPVGAITKNLEGLEMAELFDMHQNGAVAFSNASKPINAGTMQRCLLYAQGFDGLLCVRPNESALTKGGQMHEGYHNTLLGLKGIPDHAEVVAVQRDLELLRYTGGRLHFSLISTKGAVELIRRAKSEGLKVSCDVAVHQLLFDDSVISEYDTRYKVFPPFRSEEHIVALKQAIMDGTVDAIVSDHHPEDTEHKEVEFDYAAFGISSIQTVLPMLLAAIPDLSDEKIVKLLSFNPRMLFGQIQPSIKIGEEANLTVYNRDEVWTLDKTTNGSKSIYNPYWLKPLRGKIIGTFVKGNWNKL